MDTLNDFYNHDLGECTKVIVIRDVLVCINTSQSLLLLYFPIVQTIIMTNPHILKRMCLTRVPRIPGLGAHSNDNQVCCQCN